MNKVFFVGRDLIPSSFSLDTPQTLSLTIIALPGVKESVDIQIDINSPGCSVELNGVYLCAGNDTFGLNVNVRHNSGECLSKQVFRGIVGGEAVAKFDGLIYVAKDSQKTKAYQENHSILLSSSAKTESKPQLEIYADDVECSHGSSSGFLSNEELFYMLSRGIPEKEALHLQKVAFIAPIVNQLSEEIASEVYANIP